METISFSSIGVRIEEGVTYKLGGYGVEGEIYAVYHTYLDLISSTYLSKNDIYGEITISKLSPSIIAGTFSFDAITEGGGKVEVREGRFDLQRL
ncbi:hypothetical protein [Pedobacter sp. GR22-6]|uniref:hypothetical protein n=1 Tax=Pedobacter sp. GR22-6 TaxID=3127957 RepID=UPI00307F58BE